METDFSQIIIFFAFVIPSAILHEYFHGWAAEQLGDSTAKYMGRMTLNPLAHIDPFGTIFLPLMLMFASGGGFVFAYAKPVPYNPRNLRDQKWGPALVAIAGPFANILIAVFFSALIRLHIFSPLAYVFSFIVLINIMLAVFNLLPIPPLDGSKILAAILPARSAEWLLGLERYGFVFLLLFVFFGFQLLYPLIFFLYRLFLGV